MRKRIWLIGILGALSIWSCDTASSIDPPVNNFFVKYYGANGNQEGVDAVLNVDGTITLFGTTEVGGMKQLYLVNIGQNGDVVWENTFDAGKPATAKDIELTDDGRFVVVADILNAPGDRDILIMTFGLNGSLIDSAKTSLRDSLNIRTDEIAFSVSQTIDGFIVAGETNNTDLKPSDAPGVVDTRDALHLRYYDDLTIFGSEWRKAHGPGSVDSGTKIIQIIDPKAPTDTTFYFFGYSNIFGDFNPYILQINNTGETLGAYGIGNNPGNLPTNEFTNCVISVPPQSGDGFLLSGISAGGVTDIFVVKLRRILDFTNPTVRDSQYEKTLSQDLGTITDNHISTYGSMNSGFFILANDKSTGVQNFKLFKIGNEGNLVWSNPVIFGGEMDDEVGAVLELPDGSIGIIGTFAIGADGEKKMTFIKVNREGKFSK